MSDVLERYRQVAAGFGDRVEAVTPDKWSSPSPCEGWTARDVALHVVNTHRRLAAALAGTGEAPNLPDDVDPKEAWREAERALLGELAKPENLTKPVKGPMGDMPAEQLVGRILVLDVLVHTWDLARAAGLDEKLDEETVKHGYEGLKPLDAMIRRPGLFGPKVEPPPGADLQTEFLCFIGRRV